MTQNTERADFEAWWSSPSVWSHGHKEAQWSAWQAARRAPAAQVPTKVTADMRRAFREAYREGGFWTDRLDYALDRMLAAAPQPPEEQAPRYRLLQADIDRIEQTDEFLSDDTLTWAIDPGGVFVGMPYAARVLRPARRAISGEPT